MPGSKPLSVGESRRVEDAPLGRRGGPWPCGDGDVFGGHVETGQPQYLARPVGAGRPAHVHDVVDAGERPGSRVGRFSQQGHDTPRQIGRVRRRTDLIGYHLERLPVDPGAFRRGHDLRREVVAGRPEEPRGPHDRKRRHFDDGPIAEASGRPGELVTRRAESRPSRPLAFELGRAVGIGRIGPILRQVGAGVGAEAVEHFVRRD